MDIQNVLLALGGFSVGLIISWVLRSARYDFQDQIKSIKDEAEFEAKMIAKTGQVDTIKRHFEKISILDRCKTMEDAINKMKEEGQ